MCMIRGVTLDCWDTILVQSDPTIDERRRKLIFQFFLHRGFSETQAFSAIEEERERYLKAFYYEHRTPDLRQRANLLVELLYGSPKPDVVVLLEDEIVDLLRKTPPVLVPGVPETMEILAARYRLALISNISLTPGGLIMQWLKELDILHYFHTLSFSNDHAVAKPHPDIFRATLKRMGIAPGKAVHVGNDEELDVRGPHAAGMKAILFTGVIPGPPDSEAELQLNDFRMIPEAICKLGGCPDLCA